MQFSDNPLWLQVFSFKMQNPFKFYIIAAPSPDLPKVVSALTSSLNITPSPELTIVDSAKGKNLANYSCNAE